MKNTAFHENVTVITGASFGIGRELALQLADQGAWLSLAARSTEKLAETAALCQQRGGRAITVPTDVAVQSSCRDLIECTVQEYGRIDTLINNAGIGMGTRFDEMNDLAVWEKVFQVNFFGTLYCTFYALPYLKKTRGRLVGVNSGRGLYASPTADAYGPSKHAMVGFFNSLRLELAGSGVSVTLVYPEWVSTGITSRALRADGTVMGELSLHEKDAMSVETCARRILLAAEKRKREDVMVFRMRLGLWLKLIAPGYVDRIVSKVME
jgi:short-subunit dehydrogenase